MPLLLMGAGTLSLWLGWLARRGLLRRNRFAGMRTRATLQSDDAWLAAHRSTAWSMAAAGALLLAAGAGGAVVDDPATEHRITLVACVVVLAVVVAGGVQADRVAKRHG